MLICFSHLRWDFVYQRPQHVMTRLARHYEVWFLEEPVFGDDAEEDDRLDARVACDGVEVFVPRLAGPDEAARRIRRLLRALIDQRGAHAPALWYYTPMALEFSDDLPASLVVYDCMDELSAFRGAPPEMVRQERRLVQRCDVVFTGGWSLYESKKALHPDVCAFPSGVDAAHFARARAPLPEPDDQRPIPSPRLGFFGVLDERFDPALVDAIAARRPDWQIVLVGPVVKIDPAALPRRPNIHYLGPKSYEELPRYLAGWSVALMPFAINEATRYISPTKTPEYLAGGVPVVSTPIRDVVRGYAGSGVVRIAATAEAFVAAAEECLRARAREPERLLREIEALLAPMSWDGTAGAMLERLRACAARRSAPPPAPRRPAFRSKPFDYLVVGAGFSGSVVAERLAAGAGRRVLLIDRRPHVGGNAYDARDEAGLLVHRYGPHIFHTNAPRIAQYLSRFTKWRPYEHRVLAEVGGQLLPIPINLTTLNRLYGLSMDGREAAAFLAGRAERLEAIRSSEDVALARVGRELYELFFRGYTRKQWGVDPSRLDKSVVSRIPTRTDTDDRYFSDAFQMMPLHGYTRLFENMLAHPNIRLELGVSYEDARKAFEYAHVVYCGPIDEFFGCRYGPLPYRSLRFEHATLDQERFQPVAVVNHPSENVPYTRVAEYKHLTGQVHPRTSISYEYPCADGDPFYPVPSAGSEALYRRYRALADATPGVDFVGRLGTYRYYNMDQVVGQALALYRRLEPATAAA